MFAPQLPYKTLGAVAGACIPRTGEGKVGQEISGFNLSSPVCKTQVPVGDPVSKHKIDGS